jgi:hypothetical protein
MKRLITVILLAALARFAFAADHSGAFELSPTVREPIETRSLPDSPSAGASSLPDLGSTDAAHRLADTEALPGERTHLFGERPRYLGPRPYWENDPLFSAPMR